MVTRTESYYNPTSLRRGLHLKKGWGWIQLSLSRFPSGEVEVRWGVPSSTSSGCLTSSACLACLACSKEAYLEASGR